MERRAARLFLCVLCVAAIGVAPAQAQGFVAPFVGFDFGGDSGCQEAADCEDKSSNIGIAVGTLGSVLGYELEIGYARDFFGDTPGVSSNVLTVMNNLLVGPRLGAVRPYVLGGLGLIKTRVELSVPGLVETTNNNIGWDFGGGVFVLFGEHIGVRGDLRRFSSFQERTILGVPLSNERLSFQRASAALVLAF